MNAPLPLAATTPLEPLAPPPGSPMLDRRFLFGVSTSSYQIEGAAHEDGRLESVWDRFCATPGKVLRMENGDVACDHYHRMPADVALLAQLGVDAYRFSIAWPRVMDQAGKPNPKGIDFYKRLVDELLKHGIRPCPTLYHWDLPQHLEDRGGWLNRDTAYRFADYAELMTRELGGRGVFAWATHNEPWCAAYLGYGNGHHAPGHTEPRWAAQALHHILLSHGLALPLIRANDAGAAVGLAANLAPGYPLTDSAEDRAAAQLFDVFQNHWIVEPLLKGSYPAAMWRHWKHCEPLVLPGDMEIISRPIDFLGINFYSRQVLSSKGHDDFHYNHDPAVERTTMDWEVYPQGMEDLLRALRQHYGSALPPLYITENGMSSADAVQGGAVSDVQRQSYLRRHLAACSRAMEQGVDVRGYFMWSLMDNFEWAFGYERRFGLVHVDFETQQRTLKDSARALAAFLKSR